MALIVILVLLVVSGIGLTLWLNQEVSSEIKVENPGGGAGTVLVVDHAGRGSFHRRVVAGFVRGLVNGDWRVEFTTASSQAPGNLRGYDLLVLGSPTYGFAPSRPVRRYLKRLGDLVGQPTITIITGLGAGERATAILEGQVREANGSLLGSLVLYRLRPNDDDNYVDSKQNMTLAVEMATQASRDLARPGVQAG